MLEPIFKEPLTPEAELERMRAAGAALVQAYRSSAQHDGETIAQAIAMGAAHALRQTSDDRGADVHLDAATVLRKLAEALTQEMHASAHAARIVGATWSDIGHATGVSLQRAHQRYGE